MHERPVLAAAAGVVLGIGCVPWLGGVMLWAWCALGLAHLLLGAIRPLRPLALAGAGVCLGALSVGALPPGPTLTGRVAVQGIVVGASQGASADIAVTRWTRPGGDWSEGRGRLRARFPFGERPPTPGTAVLLDGDARPTRQQRALPGAPDPVRSAMRSRIQTQLEVRDWRRLGGDRTRRAPASDQTGLLTAVSTGDRAGVSAHTRQILRKTGTSHLLAISGFHVAVVAGALGGLVLWTTRALALLVPRGLPIWPSVAIGLIGAWAYAWFAGAPLSAQRAAGLLGLASLGRLFGREVHLPTLLSLVAATLLLIDPAAIGTASFQLSFGAVIGLYRVVPSLTRWLPPDLPRPVQWAARAVAATLAATLGTLPAAAWWFQEVSLTSPLANVLALPVMGFGIVPAAGLALWAPAPLDLVAATLGDHLARWLLLVLDTLAVAPMTPALEPWGAALWTAVLLLPWRTPAGLWALGIGLGLRTSPTVPTITFVDVGQGDCTLVELPDGTTWLVDGGRPSRAVLHWLRRRGTRNLSVVAATHGQDDHIGGLLPVLQALQVDAVWVGQTTGLDPVLEQARARDIPILDPPRALHPPPDFEGSLNDGSLVLEVSGVLLTGDLEARGEHMLAAAGLPPVTVLKMGHHGSRTSSTPILLDAVEPMIAVASAGRDNTFGHPHPDVLARYTARNIDVWRTDRHGTIRVAVRPDRLVVRHHLAGQGWSAAARYPLADRRAPTKNTPKASAASSTETPWE